MGQKGEGEKERVGVGLGKEVGEVAVGSQIAELRQSGEGERELGLDPILHQRSGTATKGKGREGRGRKGKAREGKARPGTGERG